MWTSLLLLALGLLSQATTPADHPFGGLWTADVKASRFHPALSVKSATLEFTITSELVAITNHTIDTTGRDLGTGTTTFRTDGKSHLHEELLPGLEVMAQWKGPRLFETVLTRQDGIVDHVTYEVSQDGRTLITRTSGTLGTQEIVFYRN